MERLNRNIETMNEKHAQVDAKLLANETNNLCVEAAVEEHSKKLDRTREIPILQSYTPVGTNSPAEHKKRSSNDEIIKKISNDIDLSNQKVLETIEFLSQDSSNQDSDDGAARDESGDCQRVDDEMISVPVEAGDLSAPQTPPSAPGVEENSSPVQAPSQVANNFAQNLATETIHDAKLTFASVSSKTPERETESGEKLPQSDESQGEGEGAGEVVQSETESTNKASILQWLSLSSHPKDWLGEDKCFSQEITAAELGTVSNEIK